jgi:Spy/CpxP family protein refolding chaperone
MSAPKLTVLILTAVAGASLTAYALAGPLPGDGFPGVHKGRGAHLMKMLHLSADQRAQVRSVAQQHRDEVKVARRQVAEARAALEQAAESRPLDAGAVRAAADRLGVMVGERAVLRARIAGEIRQLLTPEQAERLDELKAQRRERQDALRELRGQAAVR